MHHQGMILVSGRPRSTLIGGVLPPWPSTPCPPTPWTVTTVVPPPADPLNTPLPPYVTNWMRQSPGAGHHRCNRLRRVFTLQAQGTCQSQPSGTALGLA